MAFPLLEESLDRIPNRYLLVVLAAKRSRQLNRGAQSLVEVRRRKWTSVALDEIIGGKVSEKRPAEAPPAEAPAPEA